MSSQTSFDLEVRTRIPVSQYKTLHAIATKHDTTVSALVAELVRRAMQPPAKRAPISERDQKLRELWALGYSDAEIAKRLGVVQQTVCKRRNKLGLRPNSSGGWPR
jgi:DNA-binding NarL/FixJ family response regulator